MFMALARDSTPSTWSDVDAPVNMLILNGRPSACSFSALAAIASVTALGVPGAVKPDNPTVSPFLMNDAASSAVKIGNAIITGFTV